LGAQRDVHRGRDLVAVEGPALDLLADRLHREVALGEDTGGQPLALPDEAQEQMLGLDGIGPELAGFVAGEEDHPPRPLRVAFEHRPREPPSNPPILAQNAPGPIRPNARPSW